MSKSATSRKPAFLEDVSQDREAPASFAVIAGQNRAGVLDLRSAQGARDPALEAPAVGEASMETGERLALAIALLKSQAEHLAEQARSDAVELGFLVARRILEREIHADPTAILALARTAIARAGEANRITLRLAPADAEVVRASGVESLSSNLSLAKIEVVSDLSLSRGDCLVATDLGTVDGRLATRIAEMRDVVTGVVDQRRS